MIIGSAVIELDIPASASLKDKRRVVKSVIARLQRDYNLAVAEVDASSQAADAAPEAAASDGEPAK